MPQVSITVVGNLTREPELRFTPGGKAVVSFGVAVNRKQGDDEVSSFYDCSAWERLAENVAESLHKGDRVIVTGRFEQRFYEKDGEKRNAWQLTADAVGPDLRFAMVTGIEKGAAERAAAPKATGYDEEPF